MKNFQILIILIILIAIASFVQKNIGRNENKNSENKSTRIVSPSPTLNPTPTKAPVIEKNSIPAVTKSQDSQADIDSYKYPNSQVEESSSNRLVLGSSDDPARITQWYIEKLKSQSLSVNSFVKTSTNKNVLNKLVSSSGAIKISISISRKNSENTTTIIIEV